MANTNITLFAAAQRSLQIEPIPPGYDLEDLCIQVESLCIFAGGELPRRSKIEDLVELYGAERVWTQAQHLWTRIASSPTPILKPTAWWIRSVEQNWGPPGAPKASFMRELARRYADGELSLNTVPQRHHAEIRQLADEFDGLPF